MRTWSSEAGLNKLWKWGLKVIIECDKASPSLPTDDTCTHRLIKSQATRKVSNQIHTHRFCHVNVSFPYHLVGLLPWDTTSGSRGGFRFCGWQAGGSHVPNSLRVGGIVNNLSTGSIEYILVHSQSKRYTPKKPIYSCPKTYPISTT